MPEFNRDLAFQAYANRRGRCFSCGLLGKQATWKESIPAPLSLAERFIGYLEDREGVPISTVPECVAGHPIRLEVVEDKDAPDNWRDLVISDIFFKDRQCADWEEFQQFFDPQWHFEQKRVKELEINRRNWEIDRQREAEAFQERLDASRKEWEKESAKWRNRLIWVAIILAGAEVTGNLLNLPAITRWLGVD